MLNKMLPVFSVQYIYCICYLFDAIVD